MEFIFFAVVAFIIFSVVSESNKKKKTQTAARKRRPTQTKDWREAYDPENSQSVFARQTNSSKSAGSNFKINASRVANTTTTVTRKTSRAAVAPRKLRFGEKAVVQDKNRTRARGFSRGRTRVLLDGKRVFVLVAIAFLVVYIMGQS
ncbi:hypothetical protein [Fretibacter rubidus]|uniref:hypothetical protein n=1 Tax=Fretibacter rubidus TaxID=570162 RepID=UPI003529FD1D